MKTKEEQYRESMREYLAEKRSINDVHALLAEQANKLSDLQKKQEKWSNKKPSIKKEKNVRHFNKRINDQEWILKTYKHTLSQAEKRLKEIEQTAKEQRKEIPQLQAKIIDREELASSREKLVTNIGELGAHNKDQFYYTLHEYCRVYSLLQIQSQLFRDLQYQREVFSNLGLSGDDKTIDSNSVTDIWLQPKPEQLDTWRAQLVELEKVISEYLKTYTAKGSSFVYGFRIDCDSSEVIEFNGDHTTTIRYQTENITDAIDFDDQYSFVIDIRNNKIHANNTFMLDTKYDRNGIPSYSLASMPKNRLPLGPTLFETSTSRIIDSANDQAAPEEKGKTPEEDAMDCIQARSKRRRPLQV